MLVLLPLLTTLATALACVLAAGRPRLQLLLSWTGLSVLLVCAVALLLQVDNGGTLRVALGNWPAPFGIEFAADRLSASMVLVAALMGVATLGFQMSDADPASPDDGLYPLIHGLLAGACGAFLTADLFNLYVWFELTLICALGLMVRRAALRDLEATLKYFVLNVAGTLLLLAAVALIYATTGHLNFTALGLAAQHTDAGMLLPFVALLLLALLIKAAAFPLFAWLPASYHVLPAPLLALFAALLTKVGAYALLRMLGDVFAGSPAVLYQALGWIAVLTMVSGVLGAAYHWDMRRILAFHIVSQIGYMLLGIALASPAGSAGAMFYMWHNMVVKGGLILIAAMVFRLTGHYDLRRIGGLYAARPWLAVLFLVTALAQVGIPPLSGFWGKLLIVRESFIQGQAVWGAVALGVGLLTLYSMAKIWMEAFWKPHPDPAWQPAQARLAPAYAVVTLLAALALGVGVYPEPFIAFANDAARTLGGAR
ncbi:MAG: Na+/H+ antiporter subunit D [Sulfuritalea sp.]|nr:Na+/H+ antiporter subunit D [Sulfuritalea sp.]